MTLFRLNSQTAFARLCHACAFPVCLCCQTGTPRCIPGPLESSQSHFAKQQHFPTARVATTPNCKQHQISSICDFYLFSWDLWWTHTFNWLSKFKMEPVFNGCGRGTHTNESRTPTRTHIYTHTHTHESWLKQCETEERHLMDASHRCQMQQKPKPCDVERDCTARGHGGYSKWLFSLLINLLLFLWLVY